MCTFITYHYDMYHNKYNECICNNYTSSLFCNNHFIEINRHNFIVIKAIDYDSSKCVYFYDKKCNRYIKDIYHHNRWLASRVIGGYGNVFNYAYHQYKYIIPRWVMMYLVFKSFVPEAFDIWHNMVYYYLHL
jgi:hypothetical protein